MRRSDSFRFTIRSDEHENVIYLRERRYPRFLDRILFGGRKPREIPIYEQRNRDLYGYFFNLLRNRDLPVSSLESMPTSLNLETADLRRIDPRKSLLLGVDQRGQRLELDLISSPHGIIAGGGGASKTVVLENLLGQGALSDRVELWLADAHRLDFSSYPLRPEDRYAHRPEDFAEMLQDLLIEARSRRSRIDREAGARSYLDLEESPRAIFLAISEVSHFIGDPEARQLESDRILAGEIRSLVAELLGLSESVGIHLFFETIRISGLEDLGEFLESFGTKILMGRSGEDAELNLFGESSPRSARSLMVRGRGLLMANGRKPLIFQGYRLPRQTIEDQLGTANRAFRYGEK